MLLDHRLGHSGAERRDGNSAFRFADVIDVSPSISSTAVRRPVRLTVHIIADEAKHRASMARLIFAAGHHAEVYNEPAELVEHHPGAGIVLVHDSGELSAAIVCRALAKNALWLPVIGFGSDVDASRIVAGMKAGAMDFLVGPITAESMIAKLIECSAEAKAIANHREQQAIARSALERLSERERQVLDLVVAGLSNKEIARRLGISPRTVEIHRKKMMDKLGATSGAHAVRIGIDALSR